MKLLNRKTSCAALLAAGLMAAPYGIAQQSALPKKAESQPQVNQAVQPEVERKTADAVLEKRRQLIEEAQGAIAETEKALQALRDKKTKDALASLALATGRLELILARNPKLALAPDFADRVIAALQRDSIAPHSHAPLPELPKPALATPVWDELLP